MVILFPREKKNVYDILVPTILTNQKKFVN
jgi:hypothetical protein